MAQSILLQRALPPKINFSLGKGQKFFSALRADSVPPTLTAGFRPCVQRDERDAARRAVPSAFVAMTDVCIYYVLWSSGLS